MYFKLALALAKLLNKMQVTFLNFVVTASEWKCSKRTT